jgi:beta-galactosidase/beta-glucuronidase
MKDIPRPEYPRPEYVRATEWINLNGEWDFAFDDKNVGFQEEWQHGSAHGEHTRKAFNKKIIVPFAYQTELSGINSKDIHEIVWYSRKIDIKEEWLKQDILLHVGASDYNTILWVNGIEAGYNQGGHVPFTFDIAPYVIAGENTITFRIEDTQDPTQPRGKQSVTGKPFSIDYYCTTGIWQTVWLESLHTCMRLLVYGNWKWTCFSTVSS